MEEKRTIFSYLSQVLVIFGFTMLCMAVFTHLFGESARGISALYRLGSKGSPLEIMLEFFVLSIIVVLLQYVFFTDVLFKKLTAGRRALGMVACILASVCVFIFLFGWFPADMWQPWVLFLLFFAICFFVSTGISAWKTKLENRKLQEGLEKMKRQWEEENGTEDQR